ncbi:MAG: HD family phosphohydrolase, partial [Desulfovibrionaceae bacterium]|nr:HD family phosphohydrolase [Desulfovibrionaceae bacterium]
RIIAVADTLSAMLQHRPYRKAKNFKEACAEIGKCSGTQFDPRVVEAFMSVRDKAHQNIIQLREACCFQTKE